MTQLACESLSHYMIPQSFSIAPDGSVPRESKRTQRRCPFETQGGSAKDRRRVQNRMAQRAYRQRKESAISTLKQRVLELEKANDNLRHEYINLIDLVLQQNLVEDSSEIAIRIKEMTLQMLRAGRDVEEPDAGGVVMDDVADHEQEVLNHDDFIPPLLNTLSREQEGQIQSEGCTIDSTSRSTSDSEDLQTPKTSGCNFTEPAIHPSVHPHASNYAEFAFQDTNYSFYIPDAQMDYHIVNYGVLGALYC